MKYYNWAKIGTRFAFPEGKSSPCKAEKKELVYFLFQNFPDRCEFLSFLLELRWIILVKENTFSVAVHFFLPPCRAENQFLHLLFQEKYYHRPGVCIRGWLGSEWRDTAEFWGPSCQVTTPCEAWSFKCSSVNVFQVFKCKFSWIWMLWLSTSFNSAAFSSNSITCCSALSVLSAVALRSVTSPV